MKHLKDIQIVQDSRKKYFWAGYSSIIEISPNSRYMVSYKKPEQIERDVWYGVGNSIKSAIRDYDNARSRPSTR
jgi:arginyl-tRNA--protein-N-Asp/Glu arginylyltransferase